MVDVPVVIPPSLSKLKTQTGANRKYMKILVFGESGGGKSYFLSKFPKPILAISAGGERGVEQYLDESAGDLSFAAEDPEHYVQLINFGIANQDTFNSLIIDPITATWEDWLDYWSDKYGGEIAGGQWRHVKGPWKLMQRSLLRSEMHVGMAAWLKDLVYFKENIAPGVEGKLQIKPQEVPQTEKRVPYFMDIVLQCSVVKDSLNRPTPKHEVMIAKGRRPRSVDPKMFHVGKSWRFDGKKENDTWATCIAPILEKWQETGGVDHLDVDVQEGEKVMRDVDEVAQDASLGSILMLMDKVENWNTYEHVVWPQKIQPVLQELSAERQKKVKEAHDKLKARLRDKESKG